MYVSPVCVSYLLCFPAHYEEIINTADQNGMMGNMMQDLAFAIPGVDEAMGFAEIMKYVRTFETKLR